MPGKMKEIAVKDVAIIAGKEEEKVARLLRGNHSQAIHDSSFHSSPCLLSFLSSYLLFCHSVRDIKYFSLIIFPIFSTRFEGLGNPTLSSDVPRRPT